MILRVSQRLKRSRTINTSVLPPGCRIFWKTIRFSWWLSAPILIAILSMPGYVWHMAKRAGRETFYNHPRRSENAVCSGERKGLTVSPFQNRRFDSCYLTMKQAIESGKLGKLSRSKAILTIFARRRKPVPAVISTARFMALACIRSIKLSPCWGVRSRSGTIFSARETRSTLTTPSPFTLLPEDDRDRENQPSGENTLAEIHGTRYARLVYSLWYRPAGNQPEGGHYAGDPGFGES